MIINKPTKAKIKFVSYDGKYPSLCTGTLILEINGKNYSFGIDEEYPIFWYSGGGLDKNYYAFHGEWIVDCDDLPEQLVEYADLIDEVINENIPFGYCGGCA